MDPRPWLEEVAERLNSAGMSPPYRQRLLEELADHWEDLTCEERNHAMSAELLQPNRIEDRLGTAEQVAAAVAEQVGQPRFARRHPVVMFLLLPIPSLLLLCLLYVLAVIGSFHLFAAHREAAWAVSAARLIAHGAAYVPALGATLCIAWLAVRSQTRIAWWLAGSLLVATAAALMVIGFHAGTGEPGSGSFSVGFGFPPQLVGWPQFAVPLAVTLLCIAIRLRKRRGQCPA